MFISQYLLSWSKKIMQNNLLHNLTSIGVETIYVTVMIASEEWVLINEQAITTGHYYKLPLLLPPFQLQITFFPHTVHTQNAYTVHSFVVTNHLHLTTHNTAKLLTFFTYINITSQMFSEMPFGFMF